MNEENSYFFSLKKKNLGKNRFCLKMGKLIPVVAKSFHNCLNLSNQQNMHQVIGGNIQDF